jgi:S1-C subfamily serine protease
VASEQSLPNGDDFDIVASGGTVKASLAGRDPGTNIALLRLVQPVLSVEIVPAEASAGELALAFGADGSGGVTARTGIVNLAGPEWLSDGGGRIEKRIVLDIRISRSEEGGPVLNSDGRCLGISTFGPRSQVLVITAATVNRIVPVLLKDGRILRGWLGVSLQPVAVPDALQGESGQTLGLMVMSLVEEGLPRSRYPAGDVVLSVNGAPGGIAVSPGSLVREHRAQADLRVTAAGPSIRCGNDRSSSYRMKAGRNCLALTRTGCV